MNMRRLMLVPVLVAAIGAASALPASAQNTTAGTDRNDTRVETGFDWGWLGLLGLAGLAGLKRRTDRTDYTGTRTGH